MTNIDVAEHASEETPFTNKDMEEQYLKKYREKYQGLSDKELVKTITGIPKDDDAAIYLLYDRYNPLFRKVYNGIYPCAIWYEDCQDDLYGYIKGKKEPWKKLSDFMWRCTLGTWLKGVSWNRFTEIRNELMGKFFEKTISAEVYEEIHKTPPSPVEDGFDVRMEQKVMLLEAVGLLKDVTQKFVILKTLEGYHSKEIAELLAIKWEKENIIKYDNKHNLVIPTGPYIDNQRNKAIKNIRKILHVEQHN